MTTRRFFFFFFQAEDGIRDLTVTGVQTCALPISLKVAVLAALAIADELHNMQRDRGDHRSEEHTSELQSQSNLVCRLLLEKKKRTIDILAKLPLSPVWQVPDLGNIHLPHGIELAD